MVLTQLHEDDQSHRFEICFLQGPCRSESHQTYTCHHSTKYGRPIDKTIRGWNIPQALWKSGAYAVVRVSSSTLHEMMIIVGTVMISAQNVIQWKCSAHCANALKWTANTLQNSSRIDVCTGCTTHLHWVESIQYWHSNNGICFPLLMTGY